MHKWLVILPPFCLPTSDGMSKCVCGRVSMYEKHEYKYKRIKPEHQWAITILTNGSYIQENIEN